MQATSGKYYRNVEKCRVCGTEPLKEVLRIEDQFIASTFVESNDDNMLSSIKIPLTLVICESCKLVQLRETVEPDLLYRSYFYRTGVNETMARDLRGLVQATFERVETQPGDLAVDIGANDCTMISMFPDNLKRIAVEPAKNISWEGVDPSIEIVNDYFSKDAVNGVAGGRKIKAITSTAMFYDLDNPNGATSDIKDLLAEDGICTIQVSHLAATIADMNFYDIVHEHLEYYTLHTLSNLMERHDLRVVDAETNAVNGGSIRVYVTHADRGLPVSDRYRGILQWELDLKLDDPQTYVEYGRQIENSVQLARGFIEREIDEGQLVIGLGASTKGNVLLQICGIGKDMLPYISERNPEKVGLRTLGTDIELISEERARDMNPSAMLVIPWNFKTEILEREKDYIHQGGKMLFIMPYPHYVDESGEHRLS
ncbi:MAG: hypothetical protein CME26_02905 [Gemmatimonadetes bacterium]|nr:hypothetical protein [Gemmatimonadota bacterium]|tara:strand:+ start:5916 stop:7196 length:1281 start_codon:yes stop_codon:yes gene_type:complete